MSYIPIGSGNSDKYSMVFEETTSGKWQDSPDKNLEFILGVQEVANKLLRTRGYLYLNEVLVMLGMRRNESWSRIGWTRFNGDGYISFGIYDNPNDERKRAFVNGYEQNVILDFNCDGPLNVHRYVRTC